MLLSWACKWAEEAAGTGPVWPEADLPAAKYRIRIASVDLFIWLGWGAVLAIVRNAMLAMFCP